MSDSQYMQQALELASRGEGRTAPNPPVGAVVVHNQQVVGQGFHPEAGQPHAEIFALREAAGQADGATLYVTLEPCHHQGRTGPCTEAIISAGINRVVVGCLDPNPQVAGRGIRRLEQAGIDVSVGLLEQECKRLIAPFAKFITQRMPFVTLKMAMTLDGQTATSSGDSRWISNEASRLFVHRMRNRSEAIMVGIGTILSDNPLLTTRLPEGGRDPVRIVVDTALNIPLEANVLSVNSESKTIIFTSDAADPEKINHLQHRGVEVVVVPEVGGRLDLQETLAELGRREIMTILLEGGSTLAADAMKQGIVDRVAFFIAPKMLGGSDGSGVFNGPGCLLMKDAVNLADVRIQNVEGDILIEGEVSRCLPG